MIARTQSQKDDLSSIQITRFVTRASVSVSIVKRIIDCSRVAPRSKKVLQRMQIRIGFFPSCLIWTALISISWHGLAASSDAVKASVDERFELVSIVSRLAGFEEFSQSVSAYAKEVDGYFAPHKEHAVVLFLKKLRETNHIGYDAMPSMAAHLTSTPDLRTAVPLSQDTPDSRWGKENAERFADLLRSFYHDANCRAFFDKHAQYYREAESRLQRLVSKINLNWYPEFFGGESKGQFHLVVGLLNGFGNFASGIVWPDGSEESYATIGVFAVDEQQLPIFNEDSLGVIVHEYGHGFSNPLVRDSLRQLEAAGIATFPGLENRLRQQGYGDWKAMYYESLVRACVIQYAKKNPIPSITPEEIVAYEESVGFLWTGELVQLLDRYQRNRKEFPTLRKFMPNVVKFFQDVPHRLDELEQRLVQKSPKIVAMKPFQNDAEDVDENVTELVVEYDREMVVRDMPAPSGEGALSGAPHSGKDRRFVVFPLKLAPKKEYSFMFGGGYARSNDGYPCPTAVDIHFSTRGFKASKASSSNP